MCTKAWYSPPPGQHTHLSPDSLHFRQETVEKTLIWSQYNFWRHKSKVHIKYMRTGCYSCKERSSTDLPSSVQEKAGHGKYESSWFGLGNADPVHNLDLLLGRFLADGLLLITTAAFTLFKERLIMRVDAVRSCRQVGLHLVGGVLRPAHHDHVRGDRKQ